MVEIFANYLEMGPVPLHSQYLGLPLALGSNCKTFFKGLEEKMDKRVNDWKNKILSWAGREVLIKSCLQAMPLYAMGCFKIPRTHCNNMTDLAIRYWWNATNSNKPIHWIKKDVLLKGKLQGGLGFRCFESFNVAMLMKQLWRVLTNSELMVSKILKQKYFQHMGLLGTKPKPKDSFVWKSIIGVMDIFKSGLTVSNDGEWRWKFTDSGMYSVKSGYELARKWKLALQSGYGEVSDVTKSENIWNKLWRSRVPDRVKLITWRLIYKSLPVFTNLERRGCAVTNMCIFCGYKQENEKHLFLSVGGREVFGLPWV